MRPKSWHNWEAGHGILRRDISEYWGLSPVSGVRLVAPQYQGPLSLTYSLLSSIKSLFFGPRPINNSALYRENFCAVSTCKNFQICTYRIYKRILNWSFWKFDRLLNPRYCGECCLPHIKANVSPVIINHIYHILFHTVSLSWFINVSWGIKNWIRNSWKTYINVFVSKSLLKKSLHKNEPPVSSPADHQFLKG